MSAAALLAALLTLYPETNRTRCIAIRAVEIAEHADNSAERYHVPAEILLATGMLESALGCDPRSGGSWGAPISRDQRLVAGNSDHTASALALGYERCLSWRDALSHFRTGRCRGRPPIGYTPAAAMHLADRITERAVLIAQMALPPAPTRLTLRWPVDSFGRMGTEVVNVPLTGVEYFQWMRNREMGQDFGSRTVIAALDDVAFMRVVRPHLHWGYASSATAYRARHPHATHVRLGQPQGKGPWEIEAVGSRRMLRPNGQALKMFALKVTAFAAPAAIAWGRMADSDVYPVGSYTLAPCHHPTDIPGRGPNGFFSVPLRAAGFMVGLVGTMGLLYGARAKRAAR